MIKANKILVIGDIHTPFADINVIKEAHEFNKKFKADLVLCTGDMLDQKAFSRYPKEPDDDGPAVEWQKAVEQCLEIAKLFPKMAILNSNHDRRYLKKASDAGLPKFMLKTIKELVPVPGWDWHLGPDPLVINGNISCVHGDELQGRPIIKAQKMGMNVIQGHTHQANIEYMQTFDKQIWALDAGCVVDPKLAAFDYAASSLTKVWRGYAFIENNSPTLVPYKKK